MRPARHMTKFVRSWPALATSRLRRRCGAPKSVIHNCIARTRRTRKRHPALQCRGERWADAADTLEPIQRSERTVGRAVLCDAAREYGADARQRFDLRF